VSAFFFVRPRNKPFWQRRTPLLLVPSPHGRPTPVQGNDPPPLRWRSFFGRGGPGLRLGKQRAIFMRRTGPFPFFLAGPFFFLPCSRGPACVFTVERSSRRDVRPSPPPLFLRRVEPQQGHFFFLRRGRLFLKHAVFPLTEASPFRCRLAQEASQRAAAPPPLPPGSFLPSIRSVRFTMASSWLCCRGAPRRPFRQSCNIGFFGRRPEPRKRGPLVRFFVEGVSFPEISASGILFYQKPIGPRPRWRRFPVG